MEIRELISFYHVARLRSVSRAAEHLEIGQPTVTTHLQKIEREFGVTLFDRIKRPIQLTSDGVVFYELAEPIVEGVTNGIEALKMQMGLPGAPGVLRHRGLFGPGPCTTLPPLVKQFRDRVPPRCRSSWLPAPTRSWWRCCPRGDLRHNARRRPRESGAGVHILVRHGVRAVRSPGPRAPPSIGDKPGPTSPLGP